MNLWQDQIFYCKSEELISFAKKHHYFAISKPLIGKVTAKREDIDIANKLLATVHYKILNSHQRMITTKKPQRLRDTERIIHRMVKCDFLLNLCASTPLWLIND